MQFPTINFAIFFLVVFFFSWELDLFNRDRKLFLLLASYFFYGFMDLHFLPILILYPTINFFFARWLHSLREQESPIRAKVLGFMVAVNLLPLVFFKYLDFILTQFLGSAAGEIFPSLREYGLPLGISFFTFQGLSYIIDTYRGHLDPKAFRWLDVQLYIAFFPHLVAGPIVRASEFIPQLQQRVRRDQIPLIYASALFLAGLFKKVVIANFLGTQVVDPVFEDPTAYSPFSIWIALYGYAVQIYCDFSGYSDMAIALAALLGYQFPDNFNQPYRALSLKEFWKRWHMSLSRWLQDYLYIPLGGSRLGPLKTYRNLLLTMLIGGLWHGANWTFIVWGGWHGLGLAGERWIEGKIERQRQWQTQTQTQWRLHPVFRRLFTFHFVVFGWLWFRSKDLSSALAVMERMIFGFWNSTEVVYEAFPLMGVFLIGIGLLCNWLPTLEGLRWRPLSVPQQTKTIFIWSLLAGVLLAMILWVRPSGVAPFIYFRF